jgi:hypothetical protein
MTAAWIAGAALIGLVVAFLMVLVAYETGMRSRPSCCPSCHHGTGLHHPITGKCAGKVNTAFWLVRVLGVRQLTACKCTRRSVTA